MISCPFCQSTDLVKENPNKDKEMSVYSEYDGDLSFFDGPVLLIHCGNTKHGFYLDTKQAKKIKNILK